MTTPVISLIICTRNRATGLKRCLEWLNPHDFHEAGGELVLVDNASTDGTRGVLDAFAADCRFPVTVVHEPGVGLGNARNAGLRRARGRILAFTDDDCYPAADHLQRVVDMFASHDFDYCGGRILLYDETDAMYTVNYRDDFLVIPPNSYLVPGVIQGCNMAFRRGVVETIGLFDPLLGAGTRFRVEDLDYLARASLAGFTGAHVPELVVYHHHGRKPGPGLDSLRRANDLAFGAYCMKFILMGKPAYARAWASHAFGLARRARLGSLWRELRGGVAYLRARVRAGRAGPSESGRTSDHVPALAHGPNGVRHAGHREYVGGKWEEMGRLQFEFLVARGLMPHHYLLDIACGSLRGGVHFVPYLESGHYLGIDKEQALIDAGIAEELGPELYERKKPRLIVSDAFEFERFHVAPDFALAQSLFTHLPPAIIEACFRKLRAVIAPAGQFYATYFECAAERPNPSEPHDHGYFAYTREQMDHFGSNTGWVPEYIGNWNHPRGQGMVLYRPG